jgi:hypothetical protein
MSIHNLLTTTPISNGDQAGLNLGTPSGTIMGPSRNTMGSLKVFSSAMPQTKMLNPTIQNNINAVGVTMTPAQTKVMVMS